MHGGRFARPPCTFIYPNLPSEQHSCAPESFCLTLYTSLCLVWVSGYHCCSPELDQTTPVHMNPSLTVFDVACRCTGVPSNVPCARVSVQLCLVWVPRPGYCAPESFCLTLYTSLCLVWVSGYHCCAPESGPMTLVHANLSWDTFEVSCLCTGVLLLHSRAHLCALHEPQDSVPVHRSLVHRLLCTL